MNEAQQTNDCIRREPGTGFSFANMMLLLACILSGGMVSLALPHLITGSGVMVTVKSALLATSGVIISYAVNRFAVERGAPLTDKGYRLAGVVSVLSIATVGLGLFSATYAGLVFKDVEQLSIEAHGEALSGFVSDRSAAAARSAGVVPAMNTIVSDLADKYECEVAASCISGRGSGGNGPVARVLSEKLGKAEALAQQVERGEALRRQQIERIAALHGEYQKSASDDLPMDDKRQALRGIDLNIRQALADLDTAIPVALLAAYAEELKGGAEIKGRPDAARKVSGILRQHGQAITDIVRKLPEQGSSAPAFPKQTGVSDTFAHMGHFLPIVLITAAVELVLPISLWIYTLIALRWASYRQAPPVPRRPHPEDEALRQLLWGSAETTDRNQALPHSDQRLEERGHQRSLPSTFGHRPRGRR
ncbi:hypothetical protein [Stappia sp.]|uniref:hypothetical protein n=1 Tax=Stappia sp. TaxID=1870903 RepID=UPI003D09F579